MTLSRLFHPVIAAVALSLCACGGPLAEEADEFATSESALSIQPRPKPEDPCITECKKIADPVARDSCILRCIISNTR